jgi:hypothetical protein
MRTRLFAFSATSEIESGGLILSPSQVYKAGIRELFGKAGLLIITVYNLKEIKNSCKFYHFDL